MKLEAIFLVEKEVINKILLLEEYKRLNYILGKHQYRNKGFENYILDMEDFIGTPCNFQMYVENIFKSIENKNIMREQNENPRNNDLCLCILKPSELKKIYKKLDGIEETMLPDSFFQNIQAGAFTILDFLKRLYELIERGAREKIYGILLLTRQ